MPMLVESPRLWSSCFFMVASFMNRAGWRAYSQRVGSTLIRNVAQVVTMASGGRPKRRADLADPGLVADGAVLIRDGVIERVGPEAALLAAADDVTEVVDAAGGVVTPGFVDPHTHLV